MNLTKLIQQEVKNNKPKTLLRIKLGKILSVIAALPLFTSWLFIFSIPLMLPISPTLWAKDKIRYLNDWRKLR
jgi:hypothetical protein